MSIIKAYKGFKRDMTCRGFQFREGETYELPEWQEAKLCKSGFHACENPVDCLRYYSAGTSVYREVELDATDERHEDDSKRVGSKIKIGAVIDVAKICTLAFEYVNERCTNSNNAEPGKAASAGEYGAASAGASGAASAGEYGAASAGYRGAASAGEYGAASAGCRGAASAGYRGAASAGEYGAASAGASGAASAGASGAASAGKYGAASAGYRGAASAGEYGAASAGCRGAASAGASGAASASEYGAASAGEYGAASAGYRGAASAGEYGAASAGCRGAASAGYRGAASAGEYGAAVSRGSVSVDKNGIACARGNNVKARGGLGAVLVLCKEKSENYEIHAWRAAVVDGEMIKPDTWYRLNDDGEFVECQEGANDGDDD